MKNIILIAFGFFYLNSGLAQEKKSIQSGEKLIYTVSYNMSGLMTQLAQVTLETETVNTTKNTLYHLSCQAETYSKWDTFFKIRDLYESYVNTINLKPSLYKRAIYEGKYIKKEKYIFKNNGATVVSTVSKKNKAEVKTTFSIGPNTSDAVTTIYKLRNVDFNKFKAGQIKNFTVVFDEKEVNVTAKYLGKEKITVKPLGEVVCYKIAIGAKTKVFKGTDKNIIWLTADTKKIPVLIQFSIPVGTGQMILTNAIGI